MLFKYSFISFAVCSALSVANAATVTQNVPATSNTSTTAAAQAKEQSIEVITVNGGFRVQNLQKTANAISVIGEQAAALRNAENLEDMIALAPNVNFSSGSQRARYYQIRGIGERSQFNEPINPSVGLFIDDIDFSGMGSISSTFDLAKVEVFRGPQGTRFGANAMAGLIQIDTQAPTDQFMGNVQLSAGNYHSYGAGVALSGPINNTAKYSLAAHQYNSDGFMHNTYLQRKDTNNRDEFSTHGKLNLTLTQHLTVDLAAYYFNFNDGYDAFSLDNNRTTMSDQPGFDNQKSTAFSSKFTYTGFTPFTLISIFTHANNNLAYGYDEDWSYVGMNPDGYSSTDHYFRKHQLSTGELRFVSNTGAALFNGTTSYVFGVYYKRQEQALHRQYTYLTNDFYSTFATKTMALYGQFDSHLNQQLTLTSGLRVERRVADYNNSLAFSDSPINTMVGGKFVLSYQVDQQHLVYGQVSRGYKAGGVNTDGTLPSDLRTFKPEFNINYELGYKVNFLSHNQAFARIAMFYMDRTRVQIRSSKTILRTDGSSEFIDYLGNAASGNNKGIELESGWQVNDVLQWYASVGLLATKFNHFINASGENLSGRDQAHAPHYQGSIGVKITPDEHWLLAVSADSKASYYFSDSHNQQSSPATILNASVSYQTGQWQVQLWARNLLNKNYATRGFYFGNDPRDGYAAKTYTQLAEPLVFGIKANYHF